jgi:hypothetical protein
MLGCASERPLFETVTTLPEPARHPAGADIELAAELPAVERRADTEPGLVVLETPADPGAAAAVVAALLRAIVAESPGALGAVLAPGAVMQDGARRENAQVTWAQRFARFDYRSLAGETLYRASELRMREDSHDLWVSVPLEIAWGSRPRMLGDELTLRLTPSGASWAVSEIIETFRSP